MDCGYIFQRIWAFCSQGQGYLTHRYAWTMQNGAIPEGLILMHLCDTRACVRVSHLALGTHADNSADMMAKGRHNPVFGCGVLRSYCKKGHVLSEDNVVLHKKGTVRRCKICYQRYNQNRIIVPLRIRNPEKHAAALAAKRTGRIWCGERVNTAKLTENDVREFRRRAANGEVVADFAHEFNITKTNGYAIVNRKIWKHLE